MRQRWEMLTGVQALAILKKPFNGLILYICQGNCSFYKPIVGF